jgi:hypothetical protein
MIHNTRPLINAIIAALLFIESSSDDEVDPDSAVRCMENISANLLALDDSDQLKLRSEFLKIAGESKDEPYSKFVRELPDMIGLRPNCLEIERERLRRT